MSEKISLDSSEKDYFFLAKGYRQNINFYRSNINFFKQNDYLSTSVTPVYNYRKSEYTPYRKQSAPGQPP